MVVGSAAELRGKPRGGTAFCRGHRAGDTGELEPVAAEIPDDLPPGVPFAIQTDPEAARYAPREPANDKLPPTLWAPLPWFQGKPAAINTYIDQWRKPILVAGDTPVSDGPMLFQSTDVEHGGTRIWVNRKDRYLTQIQDMQKANAARQEELGQPVTADKNWLVVKPDEIR